MSQMVGSMSGFHTDLKRHITTLLRQIFELKGSSKNPITVRKQTTEAKAEACTKWMASTTAASEMDVVPAVAFANGTLHLEGDNWELRPIHQKPTDVLD